MEKKKDMNLEITELFMAKAGKDWDRCYHGTIRREVDKNGQPIVYGRIRINGGFILASAKDQWELGHKLDDLVLMILDLGLHSDPGITSTLAGTPYFLN